MTPAGQLALRPSKCGLLFHKVIIRDQQVAALEPALADQTETDLTWEEEEKEDDSGFARGAAE